MALTKAEMSEYLFEKLGLSKRDAKELVELFFSSGRSLVVSRRSYSKSASRVTIGAGGFSAYFPYAYRMLTV